MNRVRASEVGSARTRGVRAASSFAGELGHGLAVAELSRKALLEGQAGGPLYKINARGRSDQYKDCNDATCSVHASTASRPAGFGF